MARLHKATVIQVQAMNDPFDRHKMSRTDEAMSVNADVNPSDTTANTEDLVESLKLDLSVLDVSPSQSNTSSEEDDEDDDDGITALDWFKKMASRVPEIIFKPKKEDIPPSSLDRLTPVTERSERSESVYTGEHSQRSAPRDIKKPKQGKPTSCFGFVSTWWAKKKEKRRQKKREAIAARSVPQVAPLKQFEQKVAKGGVAFTLEVDARPSSAKPVLLPSRPGTPCVSYQDKMSNASKRRDEMLMKRAHSRTDEKRYTSLFFWKDGKMTRKIVQDLILRRAEILERKADIEYGFRTKAKLTIVDRQGRARRNRQNQKKPARQGSFSTLGTGSETSLF